MSKAKFAGFKFIGGDSLYLVGVPARNVTYEEADELGLKKKEILASGLYEEVPVEDTPPVVTTVKTQPPPLAPVPADQTNSNTDTTKTGGNS